MVVVIVGNKNVMQCWMKLKHLISLSLHSGSPLLTPGPLDTGMQLEARTLTEDDSLRNTFADMFSKGKLLTCEASCAKLTTLLLKDEYTSGAHVDFYDV